MQLERASQDADFDNADVGLVLIADCSNDIRAMVTNVRSRAITTIGYSTATFVNARVIVVPVIWPSNARSFAQQVPGGYQEAWPDCLSRAVQDVRDICRLFDAEFVEDSWTWLTGRDDWMKPNEVHPNEQGYAQVRMWFARYLRGETTTAREPATVVAPKASQYTTNVGAGFRPLTTERHGWQVTINGAIKTTAPVGTDWTWGVVGNGFRPSSSVHLVARINGSRTFVPVEVFPSGDMRVYSTDVPAGTVLLVSGAYNLAL